MRTEPDFDALVSRLREALPALLAVYVFGSQATGQVRDDSDLDLAVLVAGSVDAVRLWELAQDLQSIADCVVDLVDLRAASTVMQHQIITTGQRLWARDAQSAVYESFILGEKVALDAARAGVLDDIQREGTVYGR